MDFNPEEGDTVVLQLVSSYKPKKKITSKLDDGVVMLDVRKLTLTHENVKVSSEGDVEVRFEGENWERLVRLNHSQLRVKVTQDGDKVSLRFRKKF